MVTTATDIAFCDAFLYGLSVGSTNSTLKIFYSQDEALCQLMLDFFLLKKGQSLSSGKQTFSPQMFHAFKIKNIVNRNLGNGRLSKGETGHF